MEGRWRGDIQCRPVVNFNNILQAAFSLVHLRFSDWHMAKIIKRKSLESPLAVFTGKVSSHFVGVTEWGNITAGAFALSAKRLVKFTPDERQSVYVCKMRQQKN